MFSILQVFFYFFSFYFSASSGVMKDALIGVRINLLENPDFFIKKA